MQFQITVRYKPRPNSNVGKYIATGLGRQASVVNDFTGKQYLRAAKVLAKRLGASVTSDDPVDMSDDGQRQVFEAETGQEVG
jgi:hypothetical protein